MRPFLSRWVLAASLGLLVVAVERPSGTMGATPPPPAAPGPSPVVAKVGKVTITAADLERSLSIVPPFQLRAFGTTPAEIRRAFLQRVMIPKALLAQGAVDAGLDARDDVRERIRGALRTSMLSSLRAEVARTTRIDDAEVRAYYDKNSSKFRSPERYAAWIIATRLPEEAREIIEDLKKDASPKHWSELARSKSIDGATAMRGGDLRFVSPDGTTQEPGLKVSKVVVEAIEKLKDAEISPEPVKDGDRWVIVWRKMTMKPVERSIELESTSIKQLLLHSHADAKLKATLAALRKDHLIDHEPEVLDSFDVTPQGDLTPVRRPGSLPSGRRAPVNPVPSPTTGR